ncbi:hypothetical protein SCHPADRAFT_933715 [Schizopora paradoxa]|uniref:Uncharacterized protein n=1 Tax=Schizopora paradoxa TaxID=27342 RepID=A0A0H2R1P1_9AGAM|nr:hypothetical protein SCHPADRAFT_933715 [Schizopora paradoxa]
MYRAVKKDAEFGTALRNEGGTGKSVLPREDAGPLVLQTYVDHQASLRSVAPRHLTKASTPGPEAKWHLSLLQEIAEIQFPNNNPDELYLIIYYDSVQWTMSISIAHLSCHIDAPASVDRIRRFKSLASEGNGLQFFSRLVEIHFYGKNTGVPDTFDFLFPQNFYGLPKIREGITQECLVYSQRSNAVYRSHYHDFSGDREGIPIYSDPDELDAVLSFVEKETIEKDDDRPYPLNLKRILEKIEDAEKEYVLHNPFDGGEIL